MTIPEHIVGAFIDAAVQNRPAALKLLKQYPAMPTAKYRSETALHFLVTEGFLDAAIFCIQHRFDINSVNDFGDTPLSIACQIGDASLVDQLLAHGADPNLASAVRDCPLHCCLQLGRTDLMALLLDAGADPYYVTDLEETIFDLNPNDDSKRRKVSNFLADRGIDIANTSPDRG